MIELIVPCEVYLPSYEEAFDEYTALGNTQYGMTDPHRVDVLEKYENYRLERNLTPDRVGSDFYWLVDTDNLRFLGEIAIRHRLNPALEIRGGHIGYVVRYGEWGKGYGSLMLKLALGKAREMGLKEVLLTCTDTNLASARVMEKNGLTLTKVVAFPENGEITPIRHYRKVL